MATSSNSPRFCPRCGSHSTIRERHMGGVTTCKSCSYSAKSDTWDILCSAKERKSEISDVLIILISNTTKEVLYAGYDLAIANTISDTRCNYVRWFYGTEDTVIELDKEEE